MYEIINSYEIKMDEIISNMEIEINKLKTNLANPGILSNIKINYYGSKSPISQVSKISIVGGQKLIIKPYEKTMLRTIATAIVKADLGLNPLVAGDFINIIIPQLTEETRKEIVKKLHKIIEKFKVSIRNIRRIANTNFKSDKTLSKNQIKDLEDKVQKLTDIKIKKINELSNKKEKQILTV